MSDAEAEIQRLRAVVDQFRLKAREQPDSLFPAHADALLRLGSLLAETGEVDAALAAADEAVQIYRLLAEVDPDSFRMGLASALNNWSSRLSEGGKPAEADAAVAEAVAEARMAMAARPDHARFILVSCLINLAGSALRVGDAERCLNHLSEATEVFKSAGEAGVTFLGPMIEALHRAALAFGEIGLWGEAVDTRRLMLALFPGGPPPSMVHLLALTLQQASLAMAGAERLEVAQQCADEAVELAHLLFDKDPVEYRLILAQALGNQGGRRFQRGETQSALDVVLESVNLFHQVVNTDPGGAVPSLILTLGTLSAILHGLGLADQAAIVDEQKAQLQQTLERMLAQKG
ncbi:hypothetical protein A6A04_12965 [Paramagnetospirillum marisnigri]|uniref:Tetratricopeptide repeat protein n=2 Tax=Paramagnetospirillum marisnigri TaxID=1285242 RepID=A0A178MVX2_9PROT|nr:hypothetical protein A6A04_12965 [Paramagnetospirillum marisnigri]